jgi:DNA polymerase III alpha subunit
LKGKTALVTGSTGGIGEAFARAFAAHAETRSAVEIAGNVICRQRPGTAKGFVFISLEDETGVSNAIVTPDLFEKMRLLITEEPFLLIEGEVQNSDGVVLIKAREIKPLVHDQLRRFGLDRGDRRCRDKQNDDCRNSLKKA